MLHVFKNKLNASSFSYLLKNLTFYSFLWN